MDEDNRPKRKVRTGLIKLFRDALDEALEGDPVQPIKDGYKKLDNEYTTEIGINPAENTLREDPLRRIKDSYDKILDNEDQAQAGSGEDGKDDPLQRIRNTYDSILNNENTGPAAAQDAPEKDNKNSAGIDPFQRVREAYGQMFDDRENKYREDQEQNSEQKPWWKKLF